MVTCFCSFWWYDVFKREVSSNKEASEKQLIFTNNRLGPIVFVCLYTRGQRNANRASRFTMHAVELMSFHYSVKTDNLKPWLSVICYYSLSLNWSPCFEIICLEAVWFEFTIHCNRHIKHFLNFSNLIHTYDVSKSRRVNVTI